MQQSDKSSAASSWDTNMTGYATAVRVIRFVWPARNRPGIDRMVLRGAIAQARRCSETKQGWERVEELREKAARRGRIDHAEGARYATADWDDVLFLIAEIDELRAALNHKEEA